MDIKVNNHIGKLRIVKNNLNPKYNSLIDWNTTKLKIYDTKFEGYIHVQLKRNVTIQEMINLINSITKILRNEKAQLKINANEVLLRKKNKDEFYFKEDEEYGLIFYNQYLEKQCKDYIVSETVANDGDSSKVPKFKQLKKLYDSDSAEN